MVRQLKWVLLLAASVIMAGCGAASGSAEILTEDYDGSLPVMVQLIVGTLELDGTEWAVTPEQAAELLPLWKAVRSLSESDTAAEAEIEAVVDQIGASLTDEQLQAIAQMQLTQEDLFGTIQELGVLPEGGEVATGDGGSLPGGVFIAPGGDNPPAGGQPGGGFITGGPGGQGPGGQDAGGFSQDLDPEQIATLEARRESGEGPGGRMALFLIDPLIERLEEIAAG